MAIEELGENDLENYAVKNNGTTVSADEVEQIKAQVKENASPKETRETVEVDGVTKVGDLEVPNKFVNAKGEINWQAYAQELTFKAKGGHKSIEGEDDDSEDKNRVAEMADKLSKEDKEGDGEEEETDLSDLDEKANKALADAGLNTDEITASLTDNRDLSDDQYDALVKAGYSRDLVKSYVSMFNQAVDMRASLITNAFGGEDGVKEAFNWANENLSKGEISHIDSMIHSDNWQLGVRTLQSLSGIGGGSTGAAKDTTGKAKPKLLNGGNRNGQGTGDVFQIKNAADLARLQSDERFRKGEGAFVSKVLRSIRAAKDIPGIAVQSNYH